MVSEPERDELRRWLAARPRRVSSILARVEVARAVRRRDASPALSLEVVWRGISLVACDRLVVERAAALEPPTLRTLDSIHLASALEFGGDLEAFVTYDERLGDAARAHGLRVEAPGRTL